MTLMKLKGQATVEDLLRCPKDGRKYELVDGEILVSPAGARHAEVAFKIAHIVATFLEKYPVGKVYGDNLGITFPNRNVRSPDVTFVRAEKLPGGKSPESFGEFIPDLAVESYLRLIVLRKWAVRLASFLNAVFP